MMLERTLPTDSGISRDIRETELRLRALSYVRRSVTSCGNKQMVKLVTFLQHKNTTSLYDVMTSL